MTRGDQRVPELWTVSRTGHGLRRLAILPALPPDGIGLNTELAWTDEGVFYSDEAGLHLVTRTRQRVVLNRVEGQAVSGDGQWLYVERSNGSTNSDLWRLHPDGSALQRLITNLRPHEGTTYFTRSTPSYDGTQLLTTVTTSPFRYVIHDATRAPSATDPALTFVGQPLAITWN